MSESTERTRYPCKPFPYKRWYGYRHPCADEGKTVEIIMPAKEMKESVASGSEEASALPEISTHSSEDDSGSSLDQPSQDFPQLLRKCSFPYHRRCKSSCRSSVLRRSTFNSLWYPQFLYEWKRPREKIICISPPMMDSYEILCSIPICEPEPVVYERERAPFDYVNCVFCDKSLYYGGTIYDLHEKVPLIKKASEEKDDDVAYRIGIRTRVTVHKSCYEEYVKRPSSILVDYDPDACEVDSKVEVASDASCKSD